MPSGDGADRQLAVEGNERAGDAAGSSGERIEGGRGDESFQNSDQAEREPEFGDGIIEISGQRLWFLRDAKRNFVQTPQDILSRRKSCAVSDCATACGFTARRAAEIAARN